MSQQVERNAPTTQTSWVNDLFDCIDRRDASGFVDFLTDDATFRFGNAPAVSGRADIEAAVAGFFAAIGGVSHRVTLTADLDAHFLSRGEVTYTRLDGSQITLPFANVFEMDNGRVRDYHIYADLTPLWTPPET